MDPRHPQVPPPEVNERELNKGRAPIERQPPRPVPSRRPTAEERAQLEANRGRRPRGHS